MLKYRRTRTSSNCLCFYFLLICVLFTFFLNITPLTAFQTCSEFKNLSQCQCYNDYRRLTLHCRSFVLNITKGREVIVQCNNVDIGSFFKEVPDKILIGPYNSVRILNCSFGHNDSILNLTNYIGVSGFKFLNFIGYQKIPNKLLFEGLQNVENLDCAVESFEALPNDLFENMPNVKNLLFYTNQTRLPEGIFHLFINLQRMKIDGKYHLMEFPEGIFQRLKNLEYVSLNRVKNLNLPKDIFASTTATTMLELNENTITTLPRGILDKLTNLKYLYLENNSFKDLPHDLLHKTSLLTDISLSTNLDGNLRTLPSEFFANLTSLKRVSLSGVNLEELPENLFYGSPSLLLLFLSRNKLRNLPSNLFRNQEDLERLDLDENLLITLPDDIFTYTRNLLLLNLSHNQLTEINDSIFRSLKSLRRLSLAYNKIKFIADDAFHYTKLITLDLTNNQLTTISSATFSSLNSMWHLQLNNNNLASIPSDAFCSSKDLQMLNLEHNNLNSNSTRPFLNCLFSLGNLRSLDLSYNEISIISKDDLKFSSTDLSLKLTGNRIETLDFSSIDFNSLNGITFSLHDNPIKCDCKIVDFVEFLKQKTNAVIGSESLLCKQPTEFQGKKLLEIDPCDLEPNLCCGINAKN